MAPRRSRSRQQALRNRATQQRAATDPAGGPNRSARRSGAAPRGRRPARRSFWSGPYPYLGFLGAAVIVVLVIVVVAHFSSGSPTPTTGNGSAVRLASTVPASVFNQVGLGSVEKGNSPLSRAPSGAPSLTGSDGRPEFLYMGALWCPYCAAERWVMLTAVSRFGTLSGVQLSTSSGSDVYPNTPTFSFHGSSWQSSYVDFVPVEYQDRDHNPLETPTAQQSSIEQTVDSNGNIPFLYLDGKFTQSGASYSPQDLAGLSQGEIASRLHNAPSSTVAKDILGNANLLSAAICGTTGGQPATVCQSPGVKAAEPALP